MSINYDFTDLEVFLAVKDTGSFHVASQRLNLSQSAVTRRIKKLETALNTVLFDRTTRLVRPTLAAKRLQPRAEAILNDVGEATRAMRDESVAFAYQRGLVVTLATIPTVIASLIPPALEHFRSAGHSSRLRILDFAANEVSEAVAQGEADFGLCSIPTLEPNIEFETLFEDKMVLAMPTGHWLARKDAVFWSDLNDEILILAGRGTGNRMLIDEAVARSRLSLNWTFEVERSTTALDLVGAGSGIAVLPRSALLELPGDRIAWRQMEDPDVTRPIGLITRVGQADTSEIAALKMAIRSTVQSQFEQVLIP